MSTAVCPTCSWPNGFHDQQRHLRSVRLVPLFSGNVTQKPKKRVDPSVVSRVWLYGGGSERVAPERSEGGE